MRYVMLGLCALAAAPVTAQETAPMPRQTPAVTYYETQERPGLFSRIFNRSRTTNPGSPMMIDPATGTTTTTTVTPQGNIVTASANMTPMYDRRGRIIGYQPVNPVPATGAVATRTEPIKSGETTINPAKTTPQTTTAAMTPMYDRRGRFIGWQQLTPGPVVTRTETIRTPANPVTPAANTVNPNMAPNGQVVQAGYTEPEQPRRGILSRIFRR